MPSARRVRAQLPKGKLAARRRESEAEFESARVRKGSRRCGTLIAKAEQLSQPNEKEEMQSFPQPRANANTNHKIYSEEKAYKTERRKSVQHKVCPKYAATETSFDPEKLRLATNGETKSEKRSYLFAGKLSSKGGNNAEAEGPLEQQNRAKQATLHKTTQRRLLAYKYTYPISIEPSKAHKLGNRVEQYVTAGAGHISRTHVFDAIVACGQRKLNLRIDIQQNVRETHNQLLIEIQTTNKVCNLSGVTIAENIFSGVGATPSLSTIQSFRMELKLVESKTRTYHGRFGSRRTAGRRGGAGQDGTPTEQFAQKTSVPHTLKSIEDTSLERLRRSTNKRNPM